MISEASPLCYSGAHVVGIGIQGSPPAHLREKNWLYFPHDTCSSYRVAVFSNYSPHNVPGDGYLSLMAEVADSSFRPMNQSTVVQKVLGGMRNTRLLGAEDRIASSWHYYAAHGSPTPTVDRDTNVNSDLTKLKSLGILSRAVWGLAL